MKLFISRNRPDSELGKVFHLRKNCSKGARLMEISIRTVELLRRSGIRRICLACRKFARRPE